MNWIPEPAGRRPRGLRPWRAPSLAGRDAPISQLSYIVVHEIIEDAVTLTLSPWPAADSQGRLRFDVRHDPVHVAVGARDLCRVLKKHRLHFSVPNREGKGKNGRELRVGAVFAAKLNGPPERAGVSLEQWIARIYDITADARYVAKLSHYGALTEKWNYRRAKKLGLAQREEQES